MWFQKYKQIMNEKNYNWIIKQWWYMENWIFYDSKNPWHVLNLNKDEVQDPKTKKTDNEMYIKEDTYIKSPDLKKDEKWIIRNKDWAVIPNDTTLSDWTTVINWWIIVKPQNYDNDDYLDSNYFLDNKVIEVIRKVNMSNPKEILDIEIFKFLDNKNNHFEMSVSDLESRWFIIDHKNWKLLKWEKILNERLNLWIDNEYRINKLKSSLSYKLLLEFNKSWIIVDNKKDLLKIENKENFINIDLLDKNDFLLIIDKKNKKVYFSLLEWEKWLKLQLNKQYLLEWLYWLNIPQNIELELYWANIITKWIKWYSILPQLKDIDFNNTDSIEKINLSNVNILKL